MPKYKYYVNEEAGVVVCMSTYAKKPVKGVAKCSEEDKFDINTGKYLARLRCDLKVAEKRVKNAELKYSEANYKAKRAVDHLSNMMNYCVDALAEYDSVKKELEAFAAAR